MLTAINGYYDGIHIVLSDNIKLKKGQKVIITAEVSDTTPQKNLDLSRFMGRGKKMFKGDAAEFIKELRENDRV